MLLNNMQVEAKEPFLRRVRVKNYKSIGKCDVELHRLSILVGRNGAGKSNFLDCLRFVKDSLSTTLEHAIQARGGIDYVRRKSRGHPRNFAISLTLNLDAYRTAQYGFEIAAQQDGAFAVKQEQAAIIEPNGDRKSYFRISGGVISESSEERLPGPIGDRLFLVAASGFEAYRPIYDALSSMGFYNLNPESMKDLQSADAGELLHRDGSNVASVIARLQSSAPAVKRRLEDYLSKIVEGIDGVDRVTLGPKETVEFRQRVVGSEYPLRFYANNMSDGTLRALGTLVAVSQLARRQDRVRLVGIEEPETALHPAAAGILMDALQEASELTQIIVTTHSADLIDEKDLDPANIFKVTASQGETFITRLDQASIEAVRTHLYTAGELHRMDQLEADPADLKRQEQFKLFDH